MFFCLVFPLFIKASCRPHMWGNTLCPFAFCRPPSSLPFFSIPFLVTFFSIPSSSLLPSSTPSTFFHLHFFPTFSLALSFFPVSSVSSQRILTFSSFSLLRVLHSFFLHSIPVRAGLTRRGLLFWVPASSPYGVLNAWVAADEKLCHSRSRRAITIGKCSGPKTSLKYRNIFGLSRIFSSSVLHGCLANNAPASIRLRSVLRWLLSHRSLKALGTPSTILSHR